MNQIIKNSVGMLLALGLVACSQEPSDTRADQPSVAGTQVQAELGAGKAEPQKSVSSDTKATTGESDPNTPSDVFNLEQVKQKYANARFQVADISERTFDGGGAVAVTFSVPLNPAESFSHFLQISTKKGPVAGNWVLSDSGKIAYFENIEPGTTYSVKVDWKLSSALGQQLSTGESKEVHTRAVNPSVSFTSSGHFLPLDLHSGLPVTTLNVPEVDVNFHRVGRNNISAVVDRLGSRQLHGYYNLEKVAKLGELIHSGRYELPADKNKRRTFNLPLHEVAALQEPGFYIAVMNLPGNYSSEMQATYFMVTDLGVHIRRYEKWSDVYVNSLKTSKPVEGVKLQLINNNNTESSVKVTDEKGTANLQITKSTKYLIATYQDSFTFIPVKQAALDLSDFDVGSRPFLEHELFIYSERDLYRPGDTINFSALLRNHDGKLNRTTPLKAKLKKANGQVAKEFSWHGNTQGYYEYAYEISKTASVGTWSLEVSGIESAKIKYEFKVEEFLPERLKLTFNPDNKTDQIFNSTEQIKIPVLGEYLYGAPASGNRFDAQINVSVARHPFEEHKTFYFGSELETQWNDSFAFEHEQMDGEGKYTLSIPSRWQGTKSPLNVTVFGSLFESGGRPVSRRHIATVMPKGGVVGVRPLFNDYAPARSQAQFEVIKLDQQGKPLSTDNLDIALVREDRRYYWEYSRHEGWHYQYTENEFTEVAMSTTISAEKSNQFELPVDYGRYRLELTDTASGYKTTLRFKAGEDWYWWWQGAQDSNQAARPDKVTLALDKAHYKGGDEAQLNIVPPADGESIVVVESNSKPLWSERFAVSKQGTQITIPIDAKWDRHDLYISVVHIQPANNQEKITPTRSFGLLHLALDRSDRKLHIQFDAPEKWLPEQTVSVDIRVDKGEENSVPVNQAWVTLAAVDVGILNITDYETPQPHDYFFGKRRYEVDSMDMYNKIIELNSNAHAIQKFGGDGSDLSRGGKQAQSEVQIVSLFSGLVDVTQGHATVELALPDFNGRLKLMAVAFTEDSVGSAEQEVTVAAPVVTQLSMPRFVAWGDQSSLALDVTNLSGETQALQISMAADGPIKLNDKQTIQLDDKQKQTLFYPIQVDSNGSTSNIRLKLTGIENYPIEREWKLNARSAYPAITEKQQIVLKKGGEFEVDGSVFSNYIAGTLEASLSVSNLVDLQIRDQMTHLLRYPYGCLEQSTSSTYPWLFASDDVLKKMDLTNPTEYSQAENVERGLDRIGKKQKNNGGFGLWSHQDENEQHWLTAYVGDFLTDARQQGFQVSDGLYDSTMKRLAEYLTDSNSYQMRWSEYPDHYRIAYRAYAGYVLSRHKKANLGRLRDLMSSLNFSRSFMPKVHLGLALINQGDQKNGEKILTDAITGLDRNQGYLGDYGSTVRDLALSIHLLSRHKQMQDEIPNLALQLSDDLRTRRYVSTQERNALFLAGIALEINNTVNWSADLELSGAIQRIQAKGGFTKSMQQDDLTSGLKLKNESQSTLFASLTHNGYTKTPPEVENGNGLRVSRRYFTPEGKEMNPSTLKVGDMVLVGLRVVNTTNRNRLPDLLLVDLLPAGLELENQNLKHSAKLSDFKIDGKTISEWSELNATHHQEYRDDRYVAAFEMGWNKNAYSFYLARAVTPGTYNVPVPYVEDMYDPEMFAIGETLKKIHISQ